MIKHLRCENGFKFTPAEALGYIHLWGKFFSSNVERADDMDALNSAIKFVNGESGIRCVAAETRHFSLAGSSRREHEEGKKS